MSQPQHRMIAVARQTESGAGLICMQTDGCAPGIQGKSKGNGRRPAGR
tara:strand:+ start:188 stop:331 length:144 start_codon:yes stop_codon:yes gene_type:complete